MEVMRIGTCSARYTVSKGGKACGWVKKRTRKAQYGLLTRHVNIFGLLNPECEGSGIVGVTVTPSPTVFLRGEMDADVLCCATMAAPSLWEWMSGGGSLVP